MENQSRTLHPTERTSCGSSAMSTGYMAGLSPNHTPKPQHACHVHDICYSIRKQPPNRTNKQKRRKIDILLMWGSVVGPERIWTGCCRWHRTCRSVSRCHIHCWTNMSLRSESKYMNQN
jgi:hypothetical protein